MSASLGRLPQPRHYLACAAAIAVLGFAGGYFTRPGGFTAALARPAWHPPGFVFGLVWAVVGLFLLLALPRIVAAPWSAAQRRVLHLLLAANALLNFAWSPLFFTLERPDLALVDIAALWVCTAAVVWLAWQRCREGAIMGLPYLLWLTVAGVLNAQIVALNPALT